MTSFRDGRAEFLDIYLAEEALLQRMSTQHDGEAVFIVDVGGGRGHDLARFAATFPNATGRLILQDQPDVVAHPVAKNVFETTAHDFFTPQPVKGANAYYVGEFSISSAA